MIDFLKLAWALFLQEGMSGAEKRGLLLTVFVVRFPIAFKIVYYLWYWPQTTYYSLATNLYPFAKYKIDDIIILRDKRYRIEAIDRDNGGRVYVTKPLDVTYPREYRPYCRYVDKEATRHVV